MGACSLDGLLKSNELPPNVTDPAITQTPPGARAAYNGTLLGWPVEGYIVQTGLLSDELSGVGGAYGTTDPVSLRTLDESPTADYTDNIFKALSNVRQRARQAIGLLGDYLPEEPALRAHLYAVEGYAEVMLAEFFCSGIPLSTVDYKGDYTLQAGSSTAEVLADAKTLFDSALALAAPTDSTRILNLSRVGQARALLGLGDYAAAAAAVAAVPDAFRYTRHDLGTDSSRGIGFYTPAPSGSSVGTGIWAHLGVQDREGENGLDYRSSGDPRTPATQLDNGFYHPNKYTMTGADTIVVASGVEARLIEAEAALQQGDTTMWLAKLNALRTDGTQDGGGTYNPGTGGVAGLAPLANPGTDSARVDLMFRERAFWLFLTGHRQGDMRRLVRQYHRRKDQVYPVGPSPYGSVYGAYIDAPIPWEERTLNPQFTGCNSRD